MSDLGVIKSGADYYWQMDLATTDGITGETVTDAWFHIQKQGAESAAIEYSMGEHPTIVTVSDDTLSVYLSQSDTEPLSGKYFISAKVKRSDGKYADLPGDRVCFDSSGPLKTTT